MLTVYCSFSSTSTDAADFNDVNISSILNSFQMGYDKRVRPNYGGKFGCRGYFFNSAVNIVNADKDIRIVNYLLYGMLHYGNRYISRLSAIWVATLWEQICKQIYRAKKKINPFI